MFLIKNLVGHETAFSVIFSYERKISWILQMCNKGKEFYFWQANDVVLDPLFKKAVALLAPQGKGGRTWNHLVSPLLYDIFFELKPLAPLHFYTVPIISLYLDIDLIIELDFKVVLIDSLVCLAASINHGM